ENVFQGDEVAHHIRASVSAEIAVAEDRRDGIGLGARRRVDKSDIDYIGSAADPEPQPHSGVIARCRLRVVGKVHEEVERPLLPRCRNIQLRPQVEDIESAGKPGDAADRARGITVQARRAYGTAALAGGAKALDMVR